MHLNFNKRKMGIYNKKQIPNVSISKSTDNIIEHLSQFFPHTPLNHKIIRQNMPFVILSIQFIEHKFISPSHPNKVPLQNY